MTKSKIEITETSNLQSLAKEVEKNPTEISGHLRLGWAYYGEDMLGEAVNAFQAALAHFPGDIEALYALGLALKKTGKGPEALKLFKQVTESVVNLEDEIRGEMLRRLAIGHANVLEKGDWDLSGEIWERS